MPENGLHGLHSGAPASPRNLLVDNSKFEIFNHGGSRVFINTMASPPNRPPANETHHTT